MRIVLCGSMKFAKEMVEEGKQLEKQSHKVIYPAEIHKWTDANANIDNKWEKIELDVFKYYFEEIKKSDAILVINEEKNNIKNYIGGNSLIEMSFAYVLNKKIFLLHNIPEMSYSDEIEAMKPIVLNGNIEELE